MKFDSFTDRSRLVVQFAQAAANELNHNVIGTGHILLGLIDEKEGLAAKALAELGITREAVVVQVVEILGIGRSSPQGHTPRAKRVLELSLRQALQLGLSYIGPEHIFLGLLFEGEGVGCQVLEALGLDLVRARQQVILLLSQESNVKKDRRIAELEAQLAELEQENARLKAQE